MSDRGAENVFLRLRWPQTDGKPVCPQLRLRHLLRLPPLGQSAALALQGMPRRFLGDIGHVVRLAQDLPLKTYLMAIAVFCNEVKGKSMLAFSRDLDVQYKTAFVLAHKLREAMASRHPPSAAYRRRRTEG